MQIQNYTLESCMERIFKEVSSCCAGSVARLRMTTPFSTDYKASFENRNYSTLINY